MKIGLDIGSTTIKCVVLDDALNITYKTYERHFSHIVEKAAELVQRMHTEVLHGAPAQLPFMRTSVPPVKNRIFASSPPSSITTSASGA